MLSVLRHGERTSAFPVLRQGLLALGRKAGYHLFSGDMELTPPDEDYPGERDMEERPEDSWVPDFLEVPFGEGRRGRPRVLAQQGSSCSRICHFERA